jgi:hypothetical protein
VHTSVASNVSMVGMKAVEDFFKGRTTFIDITSTDGSSCIGK